MRLLRWVVTVAAAVFFVVFAISNRQPVAVDLWPMPVAIETRLFFIVLLAMAVGFVIGEFVAWVGGRRWRREARANARRITALEHELAATQALMKPEGGSGAAQTNTSLPSPGSGAR